MLLVTLKFTHYSPKDSESGVKAYLLANTIEEIVDHIDKKYLYDVLAPENDSYEDEMACAALPEEWRAANPQKMEEAVSLGFEVDEWGDVSGPTDQLIRWYCGNDWQEVEDAYYGVTQYSWQTQQEISDEDAEKLVALGIAVRLPIEEEDDE